MGIRKDMRQRWLDDHWAHKRERKRLSHTARGIKRLHAEASLVRLARGLRRSEERYLGYLRGLGDTAGVAEVDRISAERTAYVLCGKGCKDYLTCTHRMLGSPYLPGSSE